MFVIFVLSDSYNSITDNHISNPSYVSGKSSSSFSHTVFGDEKVAPQEMEGRGKELCPNWDLSAVLGTQEFLGGIELS